MKILELFSGTHSIAKAFPDAEIISVDIDPHFDPTHNISIFDFDYKQYEHFDYIHASPPCRWYSQIQMTHYNRERVINGEKVMYNADINLKMCEIESDLFVKKALEIIHHFNPQFWTMENPKSNSKVGLHKRPFMSDYKYTEVHYCMYNYPVKKQTIIFNNFNLELKLCDKTHTHKSFCNNKMRKKGQGINFTLYERYRIPHDLCLEIKKQIKNLFDTH